MMFRCTCLGALIVGIASIGCGDHHGTGGSPGDVDPQMRTATIGFMNGAPFAGAVDFYVQGEQTPRFSYLIYRDIRRTAVTTSTGQITVEFRVTGGPPTSPALASTTLVIGADGEAYDVVLRGTALPAAGQRPIGIDVFSLASLPTTDAKHIRFANALVESTSPHIQIAGQEDALDANPGQSVDASITNDAVDLTVTTISGDLPLSRLDLSQSRFAESNDFIAYATGVLNSDITQFSSAISIILVPAWATEITYNIDLASPLGTGRLLTVVPDVTHLAVTRGGVTLDGSPADPGTTDFAFGALSDPILSSSYGAPGTRAVIGVDGTVEVFNQPANPAPNSTALWIAAGYKSPGLGQQHKTFISLGGIDAGTLAPGGTYLVNAIPDAPSVGLKADGSVLLESAAFAAVTPITLEAGEHAMAVQYDVTGDDVPDDLPVNLNTRTNSQVLVLTGTLSTSDTIPLQFIVLDRVGYGDFNIAH